MRFWPVIMLCSGCTLVLGDRQHSMSSSSDGGAGGLTLVAGQPLTGNNYEFGDGVGSSARFAAPQGMVADKDGNVYVADSINHVIRKIVVATQTVSTIAGTPMTSGSRDGIGSAAQFHLPLALALDDANHLYVADAENYTVRKMDLATMMVTTLAGSAGMQGTTDGVGAAARFSNVWDLVWDHAGRLYVADENVRTVALANGAVTTVVTDLGAGMGIARAEGGIAWDPRIGIVFANRNTLWSLDAANQPMLLAGDFRSYAIVDRPGAAAGFAYIKRLASDGVGDLFACDDSTVRKIVIGTTEVSTIIGVANAKGLVLGPLPGGLTDPDGIAVMPNGDLTIADGLENVIVMAHGF